jgi:hypothetical protein
MQVAERVAPCVLFIDELEKAFAQGGSEDGGVSQRVLGTFLSWLQERSADVFTVATANDVSRLPAEFLRKGRFDEIFFLDLPDGEARRLILEIHLRRRKRTPPASTWSNWQPRARGSAAPSWSRPSWPRSTPRSRRVSPSTRARSWRSSAARSRSAPPWPSA